MRNKIILLLKQIDDEAALKRIYHFVHYLYTRRAGS